MAAQLSTADLKKQLAAAQARATGQPIINTGIAPAAGYQRPLDPVQQGQAQVALNNSTNPGYGGPTAADIAQLTGIDIHQVLAMQKDPTQALELQATYNAAKQKQDNEKYIADHYGPAANGAGEAQGQALAGQQSVATNQLGLAGGLMAGYGSLIGQQTGFANQANAADQASLAGYGANLGAATGMQLGAYGQMAGTYGQMSQLAPTAFNANVQAQQVQAALADYQNAALAQSNYQTSALTTAGMKDASYQGYTAQGYEGQQAQYELANTAQADYQKAALQRAGLTRADLTQGASDQGDVAAERGALDQLSNMAGGSLDTVNGAGSGGGLAAQQDALAQYSALTSPQATAKEKFLYEQQREAQEQQEAASRAALMNDYRVRGVGGSGMELASILQAGQQNSQQRLLGDLGTQAGAVDRSMQALAGYGGLASQMTAQGNQVNQANASNRLGAAGAQGSLASNIRGQSDAMNLANAGFANQNSQFNAGAANQNEEFNANAFNNYSQFNANAFNQNSMFNTGQSNMVGVANMNAYNQANQFNANVMNDQNRFNANANNDASAFNANAFNSNSQFNANAYNTNQYQNAFMANQNSQFNADAYNANSMNNSRLAESNSEFNAQAYNSASQYNAGQTNSVNLNNAAQVNAVNMSNSKQNQIQSQFADNFAASQQKDAADRAKDLAQTGITVGQNFASNSADAFKAQTGVTAAGYGRQSDLTSLGTTALNNGYGALTTANGMQGDVYGQMGLNADKTWNRTLAVGDATMGAGNAGTTAINTQLGTAGGDIAAKQAADDAKAQADKDPGGLLGTGIGGRHDPLMPTNWVRGSIK